MQYCKDITGTRCTLLDLCLPACCCPVRLPPRCATRVVSASRAGGVRVWDALQLRARWGAQGGRGRLGMGWSCVYCMTEGSVVGVPSNYEAMRAGGHVCDARSGVHGAMLCM